MTENKATPEGRQRARITLSTWHGSDSYWHCSLCDLDDSGAPQVILKRNRTELFAMCPEGELAPVCLACAEQKAPELVAEWWQHREREIDAEQFAVQQRPPFFTLPPSLGVIPRQEPERDEGQEFIWPDEL
jgi:hypothetical protein